MTGHGITGVPDAGAFLARLTRLDRALPVRLRSSRPERTALWARLPWGVLVTREVAGPGPGDATVSADALLSTLAAGDDELPPRRDADWRWPLPPARMRAVESVAASELHRLAAAAAGTLREVTSSGLSGRSVGQRAVRDALLDHAALVVTPADGGSVTVPQRLVQAVSRMGFLGPADMDGPGARVCTAGRWVGLSAPYGVAWLQPVQELTVMPIGAHPKG
ncbi:serine/threonine-protein kinase [Couchioplanes caeruleus]|uniref:Uncharacterized protein n=2 Tax=Couchioplanes caeruleus TaxID=56438 RepID=A0A1K0FP04_9ACTN|nr:hypothetical protein [Couchioplanes caeruleus]OJF14573.1 hypothetical protein BG844_09020 [Couchioplanes caeruleus subsp. caeruleus]ROP29681.1 hypothetical protein EDD30_2488 [Couchioplanes caeruleus]